MSIVYCNIPPERRQSELAQISKLATMYFLTWKKNISNRAKTITNRLKIAVHIKYMKCLGTSLVSYLWQKPKQTEVK